MPLTISRACAAHFVRGRRLPRARDVPVCALLLVPLIAAHPPKEDSMARSTKEGSTRRSSRAGARGGTATQLLKKDHATVKELFARFEKQGERAQETKQNIFSEIQRELETHTTIEEEIFYPAVRESVGGTEGLVDESLEEHNVVKSLLRELGSMSAEDEEFDAKMTVLQESVEHHVQEEEGEMFPKVEEQLGQERLQELGGQMQARKEALGQPTIKRIMSGVSGLIFGNGESTSEGEEEGEQTARTQTRGRGGSERTAGRGGNERTAAPARHRSRRGRARRSAAAGGAPRARDRRADHAGRNAPPPRAAIDAAHPRSRRKSAERRRRTSAKSSKKPSKQRSAC